MSSVSLGIDARLAFQTGVGVYTRNLLKELALIAPSSWNITVFILAKDKEKLDLSNRYKIYTTSAQWHSMAEQTAFATQLQKQQLDLMHFTYFSYPVAYRRPFVSTVHDMTPILFRTGRASTKSPLVYELKHLAFRFIFHSQLHTAKQLITPTNTVKQQILTYAPDIDADIMQVTYEGIDDELVHTQSNESLRKKLNDPFFLYCGNCYPHKNVERLINAFQTVPEPYKLVILAPDDFFTSAIAQKIKDMNCEQKIIIFQSGNAADRVFFYRNARAFIHPSLSEGFGLPLVEAMYFGLPIIASTIDVFQELLEEQYIRFNPLDELAITDVIRRFIDKPVSFDYSKRLERFSFRKMAEQTLSVYEKALQR